MIYVLGHNQPQPEGYAAFIPEQFSPRDGFEFDQKTIQQAVEATWLIGKLDGATRQLPNIDFFQRMYLQKDAASSSQIEGMKATMVDSIIAGAFADELFDSDVNDIINYVNALEFGAGVLAAGKLPLSLRFIRELHRALMEHGRKSQFADPGMFRKTQNWINGTGPSNAEYVPLTVTEMLRALGDLERFMHSQDRLPPIIKAGILHAQFELIHPFLDENGRTGRMLVTFFLQHAGYLSYPVLYLSSYFKNYQTCIFSA